MADFYLQKIEINNFRSIVHQDFELRDGLFVIIGDNKDTPGVTNGAGKTSLISAFFWAVTGCSLNGEDAKDDVINLKTGKNCKVRCIFKVDGNDVIIQRTRKDSELDNSLYFEINGQDMSCHKMSDTQERIDNYLKIPSALLKSIIIMTSSMEARFSDLTNQGRIELLESIRDYAIWNNIREEANKDMKNYTGQISDLSAKLNQTVGSISTYESLIKTLQEKYLELKNANTSDELQQKIAGLEVQVQDIVNKINTIVIDNSEIETLEQQIITEQNIVLNLSTKQQEEVTQVNAEKDAQKVGLLTKVDQCNAAITGYNSEISTNSMQLTSKNSEISLIDKWFTNDTCPTCNRKLDRSQEEIATKTKQKQDLESEIAQLTSTIDSIKEKISATQTESAGYKTEMDNIDSVYAGKVQTIADKYAQEGQDHKNNIQALQSKVATLRSQNNELAQQKSTLETEKVKTEAEIETLKLQISSIQTKLEETIQQGKEYKELVSKLNDEMAEDKASVDKLQEEKDMANFFYQQLGPKGALRPYLLSRDIVFLNSCLKRYVNKFFEDTEVYLTVPSQTEKDIKIIVKPKTGLVTPVSSLSGGERKRVDLCIQLALYDLVQSTATFHINFVCFDEIESALDAAGIRALIDVIEERQDIIPTILWISNRDEVIECIKDKIVVTKVNGESEVHYA